MTKMALVLPKRDPLPSDTLNIGQNEPGTWGICVPGTVLDPPHSIRPTRLLLGPFFFLDNEPGPARRDMHPVVKPTRPAPVAVLTLGVVSLWSFYKYWCPGPS